MPPRAARRMEANCVRRGCVLRRQALSEIPALKPYWGKPAVRNFRGDDGDVGIIRSPVRAFVLPARRMFSCNVVACDAPVWEAHTKSDLKVHLVWIPKYRKPVLTGDVAIRVRDLIRQIAMEHELEIISGKVARDHVHVFLSHRPTQDVSQIVQMAQRDQLAGDVAGVSACQEKAVGKTFLGQRLPRRELRHHHRRDDQRVHR